jgi:hypothetical protein
VRKDVHRDVPRYSLTVMTANAYWTWRNAAESRLVRQTTIGWLLNWP